MALLNEALGRFAQVESWRRLGSLDSSIHFGASLPTCGVSRQRYRHTIYPTEAGGRLPRNAILGQSELR